MPAKKSVPQTPEPSSVNNYFTKEVNVAIMDMNDERMRTYLKTLIDGEAWIAILRYTQGRRFMLETMLRSTNPVTDPHTISWAQGCLAGLSDLESAVIELNSPKPKTEQVNPSGILTP